MKLTQADLKASPTYMYGIGPASRVGGPFLFLDIDGVLNTHDYDEGRGAATIHRKKMDLLTGVVVRSNAKVVLSSAWRYIIFRGESNLTGLDWLLRSHGLPKDRLVGVTRQDHDVDQPAGWDGDQKTWLRSQERGKQIWDWLLRYAAKPSVWAVVDDVDAGIKRYDHPFVMTVPTEGLSRRDANRLTKLLTRKDRDNTIRRGERTEDEWDSQSG